MRLCLCFYFRGMVNSPAAWSLGAILGPGIGGILAEPAVHYPRTFSNDGIFGRCLLIGLFGSVLVMFAVQQMAYIPGTTFVVFANQTDDIDQREKLLPFIVSRAGPN